jgi:hypothetical protein
MYPKKMVVFTDTEPPCIHLANDTLILIDIFTPK